jgi:hypothetical protein
MFFPVVAVFDTFLVVSLFQEIDHPQLVAAVRFSLVEQEQAAFFV